MADDVATQNTPKKNVIYFTGHVDEDTAKEAITRLIEIEQMDHEQLIVMIFDSYGGYVHSLLSIYDVMKAISNPIKTICLGKAMSAAGILLAAGNTGMRFIGPHATVMVHELRGGTFGTLTQMETKVDESKRLHEILVAILARETGQTKAKVRKLMSASQDHYLTPEEAIEFGMADEILPVGKK